MLFFLFSCYRLLRDESPVLLLPRLLIVNCVIIIYVYSIRLLIVKYPYIRSPIATSRSRALYLNILRRSIIEWIVQLLFKNASIQKFVILGPSSHSSMHASRRNRWSLNTPDRIQLILLLWNVTTLHQQRNMIWLIRWLWRLLCEAKCLFVEPIGSDGCSILALRYLMGAGGRYSDWTQNLVLLLLLLRLNVLTRWMSVLLLLDWMDKGWLLTVYLYNLLLA